MAVVRIPISTAALQVHPLAGDVGLQAAMVESAADALQTSSPSGTDCVRRTATDAAPGSTVDPFGIAAFLADPSAAGDAPRLSAASLLGDAPAAGRGPVVSRRKAEVLAAAGPGKTTLSPPETRMLIDLVNGAPPPASTPLPREFTLHFLCTRRKGTPQDLHRVTTGEFLRKLVTWKTAFTFCEDDAGHVLYLMACSPRLENHNAIHEGRELLQKLPRPVKDHIVEKGYIRVEDDGTYLLSELTTLLVPDGDSIRELKKFFLLLGINIRIPEAPRFPYSI